MNTSNRFFFLVTFIYFIQFFACRTVNKSDETKSGLVGKWHAKYIRLEEGDSAQIIEIDLANPTSIKKFTDSTFYKGLYGELKTDTNNNASQAKKEISRIFSKMDSTFIIFKSDSTFSLNNQPAIFGFASNGVSTDSIVGRRWQVIKKPGEDSNSVKNFILSLNVAENDNRFYIIKELTRDSLVIDENFSGFTSIPEKQITFKRE